MKSVKAVLVAFVLLLLSSGLAVADDGFTVWGLGDHQAATARFGYQWTNIELGGFAGRIDHEELKSSYGGYAIYHIPGVIDSNNIPFLPNNLLKTVSYIGLQGGVESDEIDQGFYGPLFGLVLQKFIFENTHEQIQIVTEAQYVFMSGQLEESAGKKEDFRVVVAMRFRF